MHNIIRAKTSGSNLAEVTRSTNINNDTMCGAVSVCFFPKLVRLFHTSATVTLYKLTQVLQY